MSLVRVLLPCFLMIRVLILADRYHSSCSTAADYDDSRLQRTAFVVAALSCG